MKTINAMIAAALGCGFVETATAQEADQVAPERSYWGVGIQVGGDADWFDDDAGTGIGALARYGYDFNRVFAVEGEVGFVGLTGDGTFVHGAAFAKASLPIGPVDLFARGGFGAVESDGAALTFALGIGVEASLSDRNSARLDVTVLPDSLDGEAEEGGVLLQLGYQRRF